jgi:cytochrome c
MSDDQSLLSRRNVLKCMAYGVVVMGAMGMHVTSIADGAEATKTAVASVNAPVGDPGRGKAVYQACEACHSIDENDLGPRHRGLVGRRAGSIQDYNYSAALKNSGLTWDAPTLDRWLTNPSAVVPGTKMFFQISDPQSRADVIAFLEQQK